MGAFRSKGPRLLMGRERCAEGVVMKHPRLLFDYKTITFLGYELHVLFAFFVNLMVIAGFSIGFIMHILRTTIVRSEKIHKQIFPFVVLKSTQG